MDVLLSARREMRCIFTRSDPEIRRARWSTAITLCMADICGAAITFAIGVLAFPTSAVTDRGIAILAVATGGYLVLTLTLGTITALRIAAEAEGVLTSEEEVPPARLQSVLRNQWRQTRYTAGYWLGGAVMVGCLLGLVLEVQPFLVFRGVLTVLLGGMTTCAIAFLLLERGMRPVVTRLREVLPEVSACAPSVRSRLLLAWLLGSGIPLVGIGLALIEQQGTDHTRLLILLGVLTAAGIVVGAYTSILAAGSVADPLRALHRTMERVEAGDLSATVPIADSGEIGDLQLRFNRMTAGLREREHLRELFGRHVGTDVARYALDNTDLGGELREVSVLFIDIKGSTALAERLSPDRVVAMLNDLFTAVVAAVEAEDGWANKFEGDAALCIFGAPIPQADHARRALRAARRLSGELDQLGRRHAGLDAGIGVASGNVVAGNIGSARRYEYTVIGDPVNVAARLCELAKDSAGRLLVDAASVEAAGDDERAHWESRGEIELRGRGRTAAVYAPVAPERSAAPVS
ncbi:MAG TPA: adenylate/guanylate cyclase domain-containing protein [Candidatus Dormibacteraeota bacterium]